MLLLAITAVAPRVEASDQIFFSAVDNVTNILVQQINAETVRLDVATWLLSEHAVSIAIANRWAAGVPVRLIGDRGAIFESDPHTKAEFYWLASQGVPIRLRYNPTWYPEIVHWKAAIFAGQNKVLFGSGNFTPVELAPVSSTNYDDESEILTDDPSLVGAFRTKFDIMWNDTTNEPQSIYGPAPYLKNWNDACALESACADYHTLYPHPATMNVNTARLEGNNALPPDLVWGQGPDFNNRLTQEIYNERTRIDLIEYRLTVDDITQALLDQFHAGVPVRLIVDTDQYANRLYPEYWITHANVDKLWAAGIPVRQRIHSGVTHMKTLVTSTYATNASANYAAGWERDHNYFVPAAAKPAIYQALKNRFATMWADNVGFAAFAPQPADAPVLASPATGANGVPASLPLVWNAAAFATSYDVYVGTSASTLGLAGRVTAQLVNSPPATYSLPVSAQPGTTYFWRVVSRTFAGLSTPSATWTFTTSGGSGLPPPPPPPPSPPPGIELFWNNSSGQATVWYMGGPQGSSFAGWQWISSAGVPGWRIVGSGDFNGDGIPDVVWQNAATRQVTVWYMGGPQGSTMISWAYLAPNPLPGWRVAAVADFDRNGHPDLVWQNDSTQQVTVWFMGGSNGAAMLSWSYFSPSSVPGWRVAGAADFNGDGHPDLVWQNTSTRQATVWFLGGPQGISVQSWSYLAQNGPAGWTLAGARDFNGDGHADLIWQNDSTTQVTIWNMGGASGTTMLGWSWVSSSGQPGWTVVAR